MGGWSRPIWIPAVIALLLFTPAVDAAPPDPLEAARVCEDSGEHDVGYAVECAVDEGMDCLWGALGIHAYRPVFEDDEDACSAGSFLPSLPEEEAHDSAVQLLAEAFKVVPGAEDAQDAEDLAGEASKPVAPGPRAWAVETPGAFEPVTVGALPIRPLRGTGPHPVPTAPAVPALLGDATPVGEAPPTPGGGDAPQTLPLGSFHSSGGPRPSVRITPAAGIAAWSNPPPGPAAAEAPPAPLPEGSPVGLGLAVASTPRLGFHTPSLSPQAAVVGLLFLLLGSFLLSLLTPFFLQHHRSGRSGLVESPRRRAVLSYVAAHPAATAADVARALGVYYTAARHHLDVLVRAGLLARRSMGFNVHYFETGCSPAPGEERLWSMAARPENVAFLRLVAAKPGVTRKEAAARLDLATSTAFRRAGILAQAGLLRVETGRLHLTRTGGTVLALGTRAGAEATRALPRASAPGGT